MEHFGIIVNGFQPLTIITKCSILDVAAALDPPLYRVETLVDNTYKYWFISVFCMIFIILYYWYSEKKLARYNFSLSLVLSCSYFLRNFSFNVLIKLFSQKPFKNAKNVFYFILKALFFLKIFKNLFLDILFT